MRDRVCQPALGLGQCQSEVVRIDQQAKPKRDPIQTARKDLHSARTPVTVVTERTFRIGDTPTVNMVRRASKNALFEPGDTKWPWKGEAAATFVSTGITSSRALPTSSAGYWSPSYLVKCKRLRSEAFLWGRFFARNLVCEHPASVCPLGANFEIFRLLDRSFGGVGFCLERIRL